MKKVGKVMNGVPSCMENQIGTIIFQKDQLDNKNDEIISNGYEGRVQQR